MMYSIVFTAKMKHDAKLMKKRGKNIAKLTETLDLLASEAPLPERYRDHQLSGKLHEYRECHIEPNWLLMYQKVKDELILIAAATGTHSDLFGE